MTNVMVFALSASLVTGIWGILALGVIFCVVNVLVRFVIDHWND